MLELKIDLDGLDYNSLAGLILPLVIENPIARAAASVAVKQKLSSMTKDEQNVFVCSYLNENKNAVIKGLNNAAQKKNLKGYVLNFDADVL